MKRLIGALLFGALSSLSFGQRLIGVDSSRALFEIDRFTAIKTQIGTVTVNASTTAGLAYDQANGIMYLTSTGNDSLYTLDLTTGTATLVGAYGDSAIVMHGLEYDSSTGRLYGMSSHNTGLYEINKITGAATLIGTAGLTSFCNLGYDSTADRMYMTNSGTDSFYSIDRSSGAVTLIGSLGGPTNPNGLAYDNTDDKLFMIDNTSDSLYIVDRSTGTASLIGSMGSGNLLGLAYVNPTNSFTLTGYSINEGTPFGGNLASLVSSDDDKVYILNDEAIPNAELVVRAIGGLTGSAFKLTVETSATRNDLSEFFSLFSFATNSHQNVGFRTSSLVDTQLVQNVASGHSFIGASGEIELKVRWIPQADLEAADGWSEAVDYVNFMHQ